MADALRSGRRTPVPIPPIEVTDAKYRSRGNTLIPAAEGDILDMFDTWFGPFYVGIWGALSIASIFIGCVLLFLRVSQIMGAEPGKWSILSVSIDPPAKELGLGFAPWDKGGAWQAVVAIATLSFIFWIIREVEICKKLKMGYQVPFTYASVVLAWMTLQIFRPLLSGNWHEGFNLGFTSHLSWVRNFGYAHGPNFLLNPWHMLGTAALFFSTMVLGMHGGAILSGAKRRETDITNIHTFWRDVQSYSIGEIGIHKVAMWLAISAMIFSSMCMLTSGDYGAVGTVQNGQGWNNWWNWWSKLWGGK